MKKKILACLLACMAVSLAACGSNSDGDSTENSSSGTTSTGSTSAYSGVRSVDMGVDPEECVEELCDYTGIEVSITGDYELGEEEVWETVLYILQNSDLGYVLITDRDTIEEGDLVLADFVGYLDGEAFDNGSAEGVLIEVSSDSGYIDGFVDGLIGAKANSTVSYEVTFPEDYGSDTLNGQTATFEFTIYDIYRNAEPEDILDEDIVAEYGEDYGFETVQDLIDYVQEYMEASIESSKYSASVTAIKEYMLENCTVTVPDEYIEARVAEYQVTFENDYLDETEEIESYLEEYFYVTLEEAQEIWREQLQDQVRIEFIFRVIADREGIELDEEEFATFVSSFSETTYYGFSDDEDVYEYFGGGDAEAGEIYMRELFLINRGIDYVYENATVTVTEEETETE